MIVDDKLMHFVLYKMRTTNEVRLKGLRLKLSEEYIDEAIDYLTEAGYLNDEVYAKKYVQNVLRLKPSSANEIKIDLARKGVDQDIIEKYVDTQEVHEFEEQSAVSLANKKYKLGTELLKVKKFLLSKGYSYEAVSKAIDNLDDLNDNNIEDFE